MKATLLSCGISQDEHLKKMIWAELANMTTQIMNVTVEDAEQQCSNKLTYNQLPHWCKNTNLKGFGEMCVVTNRKKLKPKLGNRGGYGLMVRYSPNHAIRTYRIFLIGSLCTVNTRDVPWLQQYYGDWLKTKEGADFELEDTQKPDSTSNDDSEDDSNDPAYYFSNLPNRIK